MFSRLCRLLVVCALLMAGGVHLAAMQSFAWAGMVVSSLRASDSVSQALKTTFDGLHPCRVCLKVKKSSESQSRRDAQRPDIRVDLVFSRPAFAMPLSVSSRELPPPLCFGSSAVLPLDVPPPRSFLA